MFAGVAVRRGRPDTVSAQRTTRSGWRAADGDATSTTLRTPYFSSTACARRDPRQLDLTERRRVREQIAERERRLMLHSKVPSSVCWTDAERASEFQPDGCRMPAGYAADESRRMYRAGSPGASDDW